MNLSNKTRFFLYGLTLLFLSTLVALPYLWIPKGYLINSEDGNFMTYETLVETARYSWQTNFGHGDVSGPQTHSLIIPNGWLYYILISWCGFNNEQAQKLYLSLSIASIVIAFFLFARLFTKNTALCLLAFCTYFFNFYVANIFTYPAKLFQFILMPAFFYSLYMYLTTGKPKYIAYNYILGFIFQGIFTNLPQAITTYLIYLVTYVYVVSSKKGYIHKKLSTALLRFLFPLAPLITYHLIVFYFSLYEYSKELITAGNYFTAITSGLSKIIMFRGAWWEYLGYSGIPYNMWLQFYDKPLPLVANIAPAFVFLFVFTKIKRVFTDSTTRFWFILFLITSIVASGLTLYGGLYAKVLEFLPPFAMFREPWAKFMPLVVLSFSAMLVVAMKLVRDDIKKYITLFAILIFSVSIKSAPFYSKDFYPKNYEFRQTFVRPPEYWWEYKAWNKHLDGVTVMGLPYFTSPYDWKYNWYDAEIGNYNFPLLHIFSTTNTYAPNLISKSSKLVAEYLNNKSLDFIKLAKLDYLIVQNDIVIYGDSEKQYSWQAQAYTEYVESRPIKIFGDKLFVYRIKQEYRLPYLYLGADLIPTDGPIYDRNVITTVNNPDWNIRNVFLTDGTILTKKDGDLKATADSIEYTRVDPTKYKLVIHTARGVLPIIFTEEYNKYWTMYMHNADHNKIITVIPQDVMREIGKDQASAGELSTYINNGWISTLGDGKEKQTKHYKWENGREKLDYIEKYTIDFVSKNFHGTIQNDNLPAGPIWETWLPNKVFQIPEENHFIANGYANGWLINAEELCQSGEWCVKHPDGTYDMELIIEFWPQRLFYLGASISLATLALCVGYLVWSFVRKNL